MALALYNVASFPGPARSSLAVRNLHRGPGLVHHVMCAAAYVTSILLEYIYVYIYMYIYMFGTCVFRIYTSCPICARCNISTLHGDAC